MGKVENATIGKLEVEEEQDALDELLSKVKVPDGEEFRIIEAALDQEIVGRMRGQFRPDVVYNMPFASDKGKTSHRECDLVDGGCWYKKNKVKHIHVCGVGYQGALTAMRSYGRISAYVEDRPEVVEEAGVLYFAAYAEVTDGHNANSIGRWYFQPVMMKAGKGYKEDEHAPGKAQSKALRNCILALIPHDLIERWIEDYREGKKPFDPKRTKEMGYDKEKAEPTPKAKPKGKPKAQADQVSIQAHALLTELSSKRNLNLDALSAWVESIGYTAGKATLFLHRCVNNDEHWKQAEPDFRKFLEEYQKAQEAAAGTEDFFKEGE